MESREMDSLEDTKMTTEQWPKRSDGDHMPCEQPRGEQGAVRERQRCQHPIASRTFRGQENKGNVEQQDRRQEQRGRREVGETRGGGEMSIHSDGSALWGRTEN